MLGLFFEINFLQQSIRSLTGIERWPFKPEDASSSLVGYTTVSWQIGDAPDCLSVQRGFDSLRHRQKFAEVAQFGRGFWLKTRELGVRISLSAPLNNNRSIDGGRTQTSEPFGVALA